MKSLDYGKTRAIFYKMVQSFSDFDVPEKVGEFQLIDRKVANAVHPI